MPSVKCAKPQEWNSGAAIIVRSRARSGMRVEQRGDGVERLRAACARAPFGVPVVPDVRIDRLALLARRREVRARRRRRSGRRACGSPRSLVRLVPGDEALAALAAASQHARRTPRRRRSRRGSSRRATSASCGPAKAVLRNSALAPSLDAATSASTKPRWLRHMIATPSPWPDALGRQRVGERVRALVHLAEGERARARRSIARSSGSGRRRRCSRPPASAPQRSSATAGPSEPVGPLRADDARPRERRRRVQLAGDLVRAGCVIGRHHYHRGRSSQLRRRRRRAR